MATTEREDDFTFNVTYQASGNTKILLNEPRCNRFPYLLTVEDDNRPVIE